MTLLQGRQTMTSNPGKQIRLDEGHVQRGASGQGPRTPKPDMTPKGQETKRLRNENEAKDLEIRQLEQRVQQLEKRIEELSESEIYWKSLPDTRKPHA